MSPSSFLCRFGVALALFGSAGCSESHSVTLEIKRPDKNVSLSVSVCKTNDDGCVPFETALSERTGSLSAEVAIDINQTQFVEPAIRIRFQHGGSSIHCESVDLQIAKTPITVTATIHSDGTFVDVDCDDDTTTPANNTCSTPIMCPSF